MVKYLQQQVKPGMLLLLMTSIIALTLMASYLYLFKQPFKDYLQLHQKRVLLKDEIHSGIPLSKQIESSEISVLSLKKKLYGESPQLPVNQKMASVIGQLDTISAGQNVNLTGIKPGDVTQLFLFQELPFNIEINGTYFSLFNWLYQVEKDLGPIVVKEFEISPENSTSKLNMRLTLASYQFAKWDGL
jgi:Tfp pilus assembly protein PilO